MRRCFNPESHRAILPRNSRSETVMRRLFVFAALVLISGTLSGQSRGQRERDEWQKYEEQATNVCFGPGRSLVLGYTPLDRRQFYPVVFSPNLQPDLLKRIAAVF